MAKCHAEKFVFELCIFIRGHDICEAAKIIAIWQGGLWRTVKC